MFIDTHAHLNDRAYKGQVKETIERAQAAGVHMFFVVGWDYQSSVQAIKIAHTYPNVYAIVGFHPENIRCVTDEDLEKMAALFKDKKVIAVGEIGLDYYWTKDEEGRIFQQEMFIRQIQMANEAALPVVIHSRDAMERTFEILNKHRPLKSGVMHCYSGSAEMAGKFVSIGMYISLGGPVTFLNAKTPKEVAIAVPNDRLLIETDCPYLTPHPHRGKTNEPAYLPLVAKEIAALRHTNIEEIGSMTNANAARLFRVEHNEELK